MPVAHMTSTQKRIALAMIEGESFNGKEVTLKSMIAKGYLTRSGELTDAGKLAAQPPKFNWWPIAWAMWPEDMNKVTRTFNTKIDMRSMKSINANYGYHPLEMVECWRALVSGEMLGWPITDARISTLLKGGDPIYIDRYVPWVFSSRPPIYFVEETNRWLHRHFATLSKHNFVFEGRPGHDGFAEEDMFNAWEIAWINK